MRSTENVRGEWDELGERDTRVIVPGPGVGDAQGEVPVEVLPVAVPEPSAEPAGDGPGAAPAPSADVPAAVEDEIPADLGPALDAVAVVGRAAPVDGVGFPADLDLDLDLGLGMVPESGSVSGPRDPDLDLDLEPWLGSEPVRDSESLEEEPETRLLPSVPEAVIGADTGTAPAPAAQDAGQVPAPAARGERPPDLRKPEPGRFRPADGEERAPVTLGVGAADPVAWWGAGRRQPVITTETTAPIPVHLLFRDDDRGARPAGAGTGTERRSDERRAPLPRSRRTQAPTRPAPLADPRLTERPGPVLPGWAALFTASAGVAAGLAMLWWHGALPTAVTGRLGLGARPYDGIGAGTWALLALVVAVALFALCGLGRGRSGHASVLTLFGDYRGSVRRAGLLWISPILRRRRIDVRLRHWRSEPLSAVDASGTALRAVVLVVWRVRDTARATLGVADHERYLRDQVEAALARVLSQLPADAFHEDTRTLRDAEAVGDALTRMVKADCVPVGIEVYSAQPTGIEYAPEVAAAMQRCRVAAIDAKHRDEVLTSVVDAVDDTVGRLTARGIVELDAYEHKALVRDLTVAFYTGRSGGEGA
ncbi:SPFH domain-containing protein [Streptomyces sp. NBC_01166]|uniref:SPFH domain-containing protein n=1 Tax=Streptomyces sp. NBC_01166 TaxID=2903755 RepID=UPI003862E90B|nr:SPFH domain-containing protein [Streptomyces sp. NBC_01166]